MPVSRATARKLSTRAEWELLESSHGDALKALTAVELKRAAVRARTLQDKYRDRTRQQHGEARGKREARRTRAAQGSDNTRLKKAMFAEARLRFETQLERKKVATARAAELEARQSARARTKSKSKAKAKARAAIPLPASRAARKAAKARAKASTAASRSARKANLFSRQATRSNRAHTLAKGQRRQARRDSR